MLTNDTEIVLMDAKVFKMAHDDRLFFKYLRTAFPFLPHHSLDQGHKGQI